MPALYFDFSTPRSRDSQGLLEIKPSSFVHDQSVSDNVTELKDGNAISSSVTSDGKTTKVVKINGNFN